MKEQRSDLAEQYQLAGAGGIEPPNGGIKIRCLTAWLRPNRLNRNARAMRPVRTGSDNARSIGGVRPFQQAGIANFVRNQLPGSMTLYIRAAYAKVPGRFHAPGAAQYRPSES